MHFRDGNTFSPEKSGHINKRFVLLLGRAADPINVFEPDILKYRRLEPDEGSSIISSACEPVYS